MTTIAMCPQRQRPHGMRKESRELREENLRRRQLSPSSSCVRSKRTESRTVVAEGHMRGGLWGTFALTMAVCVGLVSSVPPHPSMNRRIRISSSSSSQGFAHLRWDEPFAGGRGDYFEQTFSFHKEGFLSESTKLIPVTEISRKLEEIPIDDENEDGERGDGDGDVIDGGSEHAELEEEEKEKIAINDENNNVLENAPPKPPHENEEEDVINNVIVDRGWWNRLGEKALIPGSVGGVFHGGEKYGDYMVEEGFGIPANRRHLSTVLYKRKRKDNMSGTTPRPRQQQTWMIVSGGYTDVDWTTFPVWAYDLTGARRKGSGVWIPLQLASPSYGTDNGKVFNGPTGRVGHLSAVHGDYLYVFGGLTYRNAHFFTDEQVVVWRARLDDRLPIRDDEEGGEDVKGGLRWPEPKPESEFDSNTQGQGLRPDTDANANGSVDPKNNSIEEITDADEEGGDEEPIETQFPFLEWEELTPLVTVDNGQMMESTSSWSSSHRVKFLPRGEAQGGTYTYPTTGKKVWVIHGGLHVVVEKNNFPADKFWGGPRHTDHPLGDLWTYDFEENVLTLLHGGCGSSPLTLGVDELRTVGCFRSPVERTAHAATVLGDELVIHGGMTSMSQYSSGSAGSGANGHHGGAGGSVIEWDMLDDVWAYHLLKRQWRRWDMSEALGRSYHSLVAWPIADDNDNDQPHNQDDARKQKTGDGGRVRNMDLMDEHDTDKKGNDGPSEEAPKPGEMPDHDRNKPSEPQPQPPHQPPDTERPEAEGLPDANDKLIPQPHDKEEDKLARGAIVAYGGFRTSLTIAGESIAFVFSDTLVAYPPRPVVPSPDDTNQFLGQPQNGNEGRHSNTHSVVTWYKVHLPPGSPDAVSHRLEHSAVIDGAGTMYVWGGRFKDASQISGLWCLDLFGSRSEVQLVVATADGLEEYEEQLETMHLLLAVMLFLSVLFTALYGTFRRRAEENNHAVFGDHGHHTDNVVVNGLFRPRHGVARDVIDSIPVKTWTRSRHGTKSDGVADSTTMHATSSSQLSDNTITTTTTSSTTTTESGENCDTDAHDHDVTTTLTGPENEVVEADDDYHECCAICLVEYEEGDFVRPLPCNHIFHKECVDAWLETSTSCPTCRRCLHQTDDNATTSLSTSSFIANTVRDRLRSVASFSTRPSFSSSTTSTSSDGGNDETTSNNNAAATSTHASTTFGLELSFGLGLGRRRRRRLNHGWRPSSSGPGWNGLVQDHTSVSNRLWRMPFSSVSRRSVSAGVEGMAVPTVPDDAPYVSTLELDEEDDHPQDQSTHRGADDGNRRRGGGLRRGISIANGATRNHHRQLELTSLASQDLDLPLTQAEIGTIV